MKDIWKIPLAITYVFIIGVDFLAVKAIKVLDKLLIKEK